MRIGIDLFKGQAISIGTRKIPFDGSPGREPEYRGFRATLLIEDNNKNDIEIEGSSTAMLGFANWLVEQLQAADEEHQKEHAYDVAHSVVCSRCEMRLTYAAQPHGRIGGVECVEGVEQEEDQTHLGVKLGAAVEQAIQDATSIRRDGLIAAGVSPERAGRLSPDLGEKWSRGTFGVKVFTNADNPYIVSPNGTLAGGSQRVLDAQLVGSHDRWTGRPIEADTITVGLSFSFDWEGRRYYTSPVLRIEPLE